MLKKLTVLNLPNPEQITRRYMCSYVSPESLMPPLELISCASIARHHHQLQVNLLDAIAEKTDTTQTIRQLKEWNPNVIVALTGFECYEQDVNVVREIKQQFTNTTFILFGHYATTFPEETLRHSSADYIILGEPEIVLNNLLSTLITQGDIEQVTGIAYLKNNHFHLQGTASRIKDPNELPTPAYDLLPQTGAYYEPLLAQPYGMIQTMRGCPHQCNYCVKSYGSKLSQLTVDRIIEEIQQWKQLHGVKAIRFIDDTFTINKHRTIELCKAIINHQLNIEWACLSRADDLDEELLTWMKKSGCKRIYFGVETGSQRMLDIYKKNIKKEDALEALLLCQKVGVESAAFFMAGHPDETENDFQESLAFAKDAQLNYASFNPLTPYPGTPLYQQLKDKIDFSIYPYKNEWIDKTVYEKFDKDKMRFYKGFYLRPSYFTNNIAVFRNNFNQIFQLGWSLLRYLFWDKQFVISGLKGAKDR